MHVHIKLYRTKRHFRSDLLSAKALAAVEVAGAWAQVSVSHGPDGAARKGEGVGTLAHRRPTLHSARLHHEPP